MNMRPTARLTFEYPHKTIIWHGPLLLFSLLLLLLQCEPSLSLHVEGQGILAQISPKQHTKKQAWQHTNEQSNLLKHLGGMGPYVTNTGFGIPADVGADLKVDQVYVFSRHGERFPTNDIETGMGQVFNKLKHAEVEHYVGPLSFVEDWEYFIESEDEQLENETLHGKYAGILDMFNFGIQFRRTYGELYHSGDSLKVFSAGQKRVVDSAVAFAKGFLSIDEKDDEGEDDEGEDADTPVEVVSIPEVKEMGANTLTTGKSCKPYHKSSNYDDDKKFKPSFLAQEAERLNKLSPGFNLTADDVYQLILFCPFELNAKGYSDVCDAISMNAFVEFEYIRDTELYYTKADHPFTFTLGSVYINATLALFEQETKDDEGRQNVWINFSHDTDLLYYLNALGVLDYQDHELDTGRIEFNRFFKTSELIPMGARIVVERLTNLEGDKFVRIIVNDAVIPLKRCQDGPGYTCGLKHLRQLFNERLGDQSFVSKCEVQPERPQYLSFYWD